MKRLAVYLIKLVGWRWTADAVDSVTGIVIPDAIKHDVKYMLHSEDAALISIQHPRELSKKLTHEHIIPLGLLADYIFSLNEINNDIVQEIFDIYCKAAVITREEDQILNRAKLRSVMPLGWRFGQEDIFARYNAVGIKLLIASEN